MLIIFLLKPRNQYVKISKFSWLRELCIKNMDIHHYNHCVEIFCSVILCCSSFLHSTISWEGMKIAMWHINTALNADFLAYIGREVCLIQKSGNGWILCFGWILHLQYRHQPMKMPREHYITWASQKHASIKYKDKIK